MKPVLLAGETVGEARPFIAALEARGMVVRHMTAGRCGAEFPDSVAAFDAYAVVVLSDVDAPTLLMSRETRAGRAGPNRLELLQKWVEHGGGLLMAGGYSSFAGMNGAAHFSTTPIEAALPVSCLPHSDATETPEGLAVSFTRTHALLSGIATDWPAILGFNRTLLRSGSDVVATIAYAGSDHALLAARPYGAGRSIAWTTDIGPHWLSTDFLDWPGYPRLMANMVSWLARDI